jgi:hypothetical protein
MDCGLTGFLILIPYVANGAGRDRSDAPLG